jgi:hypothetical protein
MIMKKLVATFVLLGSSLVAFSASADPITTQVVTVHGRPGRPSVVIEIQRARPGIAMTTPTLAAVMASKKD